ncbi:hypothetical protein PT2222_190097 [Paraburkholderia tropica]
MASRSGVLRQGSHRKDRAPPREYLNLSKTCLILLAIHARAHSVIDWQA